MTRYEKIDIGGKQFIGRTKRIRQKDLTSDCWMVQVWSLPYCSGFGDPESACEYLGTEECGGERIRKLILSGEYPKEGLPDVGEEKAKKIIGDQNG
jgi:hypothetical protein